MTITRPACSLVRRTILPIDTSSLYAGSTATILSLEIALYDEINEISSMVSGFVSPVSWISISFASKVYLTVTVFPTCRFYSDLLFVLNEIVY